MAHNAGFAELQSSYAPRPPRKDLFEDDSSSGGGEDSDDGGAQLESGSSTFRINEEYARRFEHNKKREDKQRLEEKYGKGANGKAEGSGSEDDSSEDETEDEDGFLLTEELDAQMSAALQAIKSKDPRIYDSTAKFYSEATEDSSKPAVGEEKEKPLYLRDFHRENLLRGDVGAEEEDIAAAPKSYNQGQEELKQSLLAEINAAAAGSSEGDSDDEAFMKPKEKPQLAENGVHPSRSTKIKLTEADVANANKDPELYLSNFMNSRAWVPEKESRWQAFDSDESDDEQVNLADEFENAYNMRFEDPRKSNEVLKTYSRTVVASRSVRREEKKGRARQRDLEKERKEIEKRERNEERARLRKLKVDESHEKLKKIKKAAGLRGKSLKDDEWVKLLEDAWEDSKWEEEMKKKFGEEYYAEQDDFQFSEDGVGASTAKKAGKVKKPTWDDDIDIKDIVPDFEEGARPNITLTDSEDNEELDDDEDNEDDPPSKKRKTGKDHKKDRAAAKRAARIERSKIEALVDTQMELDLPSAIASSSKSKLAPFRYRETSPTSFGLTASDILMAPSDAALNDFVGLKKLATFRDADKKRKDKKRLNKKAKLRKWRRDIFGKEFEQTGPEFDFGGKPAGPGDETEPAADGEGLAKKKRKRSRPKKATADAK